MKISGIFFALVIIAFLMPFMVFKCADQKIDTFSGFKTATGGAIRSADMDNMFQSLNQAFTPEAGEQASTESESDRGPVYKVKPNIFAIIALIMAIIGVIVALILDNRMYIVPVIIAVIGFIALLLVKSGVRADLSAEEAKMITIQMQFGYYLAVFSFLVAGILAILTSLRSTVGAREPISSIIPEKFENAFDQARDAITTAGAGVASAAGDAYEKVRDQFDKADHQEKADQLAEDAEEVIDEAAEKVKEAGEEGKKIVDEVEKELTD